MGIIDRIFRRYEKRPKAQFVNEQTGVFTSRTGGAYANDIYRGAVDAISRNIGKLKGSHVLKYDEHNRVEGDCALNRLLQVRPNPYMSAYDLLYKLCTHYYVYNNCFAYLCRDNKGTLTAIYPITATGAEMISDASETLYCRFYLSSGKQYIFPYSDVIHLRRNFNSDVLLGDDNRALLPALELAHTQNEGIINGIKGSAYIRGILKYTQIMAPEKLKEEKAAFVNEYLQVNNNGGIVTLDTKAEYVPINNRPAIISADQTREVKSKIYNYLGVTENIVNSSYTEDEFTAFYESVIEPFAVSLSMEMTAKVFSEIEQKYGNSIIYESGQLSYASNKTKVELIKELMPLGLLTINQCLEILNLPPVVDGDKRLQTLNVVDESIVNQYQLEKVKAEAAPKSDPETVNTDNQSNNSKHNNIKVKTGHAANLPVDTKNKEKEKEK